jgi:hypothetical protein
MFDNFITKLALKNYSTTVIWIEILVVILIIFFIITSIFFSFLPIDISIPVLIMDNNRISISKEYSKNYPKTERILIKDKKSYLPCTITKKYLSKSSDLLLQIKEPLPDTTKARLIIEQKTIFKMLFKSKR